MAIIKKLNSGFKSKTIVKEGKKMQYTTHIDRNNPNDTLKENSKFEKSGSQKKLEDTISFDQVEEVKLPINKFYDSKMLDQKFDKAPKNHDKTVQLDEPREKDMFYAMPVKQKINQPNLFSKEKKLFDLPQEKEKTKEPPVEKKNRDFFDQLKMIGKNLIYIFRQYQRGEAETRGFSFTK